MDGHQEDREYLEIMRREIDHRMIDKGIKSRVRLAELAGINADTLGNFWKGSRKAPLFVHDAAKIAKALDCSIEELLGEEPEPAEENRPDPLEGRPVLRDVMAELSGLTEGQLAKIRGIISAAANMPIVGPQKGDAEAS